MNFRLFIHLHFLLFVFFIAHAMDPAPLEKKEKSSRRSTLSINSAAPYIQSSSQKKLARTASLHSIAPKDSPRETGKIKATNSDPLNAGQTYSNNNLGNKLQAFIRKNEPGKIAQFLADSKNDPNFCYFPGKNTLLHKCILEHNNAISVMLVRDFRVYSLIENQSSRTAYECLIENDIIAHPQLYKTVCERAHVDLIVDAFVMAIDQLTQDPYDDRFLSKMVIFLHKKLPAKIFPEYATIPFIVAMIKYRLPSKNLIMQILYDNPSNDELHTKIQHAIYLHDAEFLNKNNPNILHQPEQCSLLHTLVEKHDEPKIMLFLINPYITVLVKNQKGLRPKDCLKKNLYQQLFQEFLLRETLDKTIHAAIVSDKNIVQKKCADETIIQKITDLLTRLPANIIPSYATIPFIVSMIHAQLRYNKTALQNTYLCYKKNHNYQDEEGNTRLHQAVYLRDRGMIYSLIKKPHIICLKKNKDNLLPQALLHSLEQSPIRALLFMRDSIERWALKSIELILISVPTLNLETLTIENDCIKQVIKDIKYEAQQVKEKQLVTDGIDEDGQLPTIAADLPDYATDKFLFELIKYRLLKRSLKKQKNVAK